MPCSSLALPYPAFLPQAIPYLLRQQEVVQHEQREEGDEDIEEGEEMVVVKKLP